jgi:site-specific recombinase XerC
MCREALAAFGDFLRLLVADGDASEATLKAYRRNGGAFYQCATEQARHQPRPRER